MQSKIPFFNPPQGGKITNASTIARSNIITTNESLKNDSTYKQVVVEIEKLILSGLPILGQGHCISISDVIMNILKHAGIDCRMVEVQASIKNKETGTTELLGFDKGSNNYPITVDTHVIVLVNGDIPFFVDGSIGHLLPKRGAEVVIDAVTKTPDTVELAIVDSNLRMIIYQEKIKSKLPLLHQASIINRIETDKKIFENINLLKKLNYIGIALSTFAVIHVFLKALGIWTF